MTEPFIKICNANHPHWLDFRNGGITASESAAACGCSQWQTAREIYHRKRGEIPPVEENEAMRWGKHHEPGIMAEFELKTQIPIAERSPGLFHSRETPWMLATPDGTIDSKTGLECKTMGELRARDELGEPGTDQVPDDWIFQTHHQMIVMGWELVWIPVLIGGNRLEVYQVERNEQLVGFILMRCTELWRRIKCADPPPADLDHPNALGLVRQLYRKVVSGTPVMLSQQSVVNWQLHEQHRQIIKESEKALDACKATVLMEMGENEAAMLPDGRFLKRSLVETKGYSVEPKSYVTLKAVKKL